MVTFSKPSLFAAAGALSALAGASAFDMSRKDNVVAYWGQNSYGAANGQDTANFQKSLKEYCNDDSIDTFPISFLTVFFGAGGLPQLDLANICSAVTQKPFGSSQLPDCSFLAEDIKTCQKKGKTVTLSMGGATGGSTFTDSKQAKDFADQIWNLFLGGKSDTRPFGDAVLDGVDLDIEGGGTPLFADFVKQLRTHFDSSKKYYVTAAPQCVFPDANLGPTLDAAEFDAVYVQFYNNYCGVQNYDNPNAWNFAQWDDWAKNKSPNKDVKVYIGVPASSTAAGSGYVDAAKVGAIAKATADKYSSFGGIMFWDASQARANNNFDKAVKDAIRDGAASPPPASTEAPAPSSSSEPAPPSTTAAPAPSSSSEPAPPTSTDDGDCDPAPTASSSSEPAPTAAPTSDPAPAPTGGSSSGKAWDKSAVYTGGMCVSYNGADYSAKWWTQGETPGSAEVWAKGCSGGSKREEISAEEDCDPAPTSSPAPAPTGGSSSGKAWDKSAVYTGGMCVSYNGADYSAKWWTQGETPGSADVWAKGCSGGSKRAVQQQRPRSGGIYAYRRTAGTAAQPMRRASTGPARLRV